MKKPILIISMILFCTVFIYSGVMLFTELSKRERDDEMFDELADLILMTEIIEEPEEDSEYLGNESDYNEQSGTGEVGKPEKPEVYHKRNLAPVIEKNGDCVGWIYIEDTQVNYPVMYTPNEPHKYIDKSFDLKSSSYGVPFIEGNCTPYSNHVIVYGHNMKNGSMFAAIKKYRDKEFFDSHPIIEYETLQGCKKYRVFAICEVKDTDKWYSFLDTDNTKNFEEQFERILTRAVHKSDVVPAQDKQILTLSTCQGGDKDARLILIAVEE